MSTQWQLVINIVQIVVISLVAFLIRMYRQDVHSEAERVIADALKPFFHRFTPPALA